MLVFANSVCTFISLQSVERLFVCLDAFSDMIYWVSVDYSAYRTVFSLLFLTFIEDIIYTDIIDTIYVKVMMH